MAVDILDSLTYDILHGGSPTKEREVASIASSVNQFTALVRMLELRIARQKQALLDSELQLSAAKESYMRVESEKSAKKV